MPQTINILFLAAEAEPFVKVGGLGDVAGALPRELRALSNDETKIDVRLVLPHHSVIRSDTFRPVGIYSLRRGSSEIQVEAYEGILGGMPIYFINGDPIRASGSVYSSNNVLDIEKYVFFSLAALELPRHLNWEPDIIHVNDWHTALAAYGNLVKVYEGRPLQAHFYEPGSILPTETASVKHRYFQRMNRYGDGRDWVLARLPDDGPLAYLPRESSATPDGETPARSTLWVEVEAPGAARETWDEVESLVHSDDSAESGDHYMVETDERGRLPGAAPLLPVARGAVLPVELGAPIGLGAE